MANVRRSARLSRTGAGRRSSTGTRKNFAKKAPLSSLVERDETPDTATSSIAGVLATPNGSAKMNSQLAQLSGLKTPQTEPKPTQGEMHPKTIHQTTSKAPDSGLKFGFADIATAADGPKTPSKTPAQPKHHSTVGQNSMTTMPANFHFNFASQSTLSAEAQKLMESLKADAEKIKSQMIADKASQEADGNPSDNTQGNSRKFATAKGGSGRFSDVHMAQFRKMDSIENHPSAFRARPGFTSTPTQSLKRKSSRANLDEVERPQTAGKGTPRPVYSTSSGKVSAPESQRHDSHQAGTANSAKRLRHTNAPEIPQRQASTSARPATTLFSPTKASLARSEVAESPSPIKFAALPRSNSVKTSKLAAPIRSVPRPSTAHSTLMDTHALTASPSRLPKSQSLHFKPLPALPVTCAPGLSASKSVITLTSPQTTRPVSRLPLLASLKSILRPSRRERKVTESPQHLQARQASRTPAESSKKVDFTPSVKSRYAVKLAADSPIPAKLRRGTPRKVVGPFGVPYDSSAYLLDVDDDMQADVADLEEVTYPTLPPVPRSPGPVVHIFAAKAKELDRRESKEFKSIFTDLHSSKKVVPSNLTNLNTTINRTDPTRHASQIFKSGDSSISKSGTSTIRQVRDSSVSELVQPFENQIATVPHGIPGKKRRHEAIVENDRHSSDQDARETHRMSVVPSVPGAWTDTILEDQENQDPASSSDEGEARAGKRMRMSIITNAPIGHTTATTTTTSTSPKKKPNAAREAAAKSAKERKGRGILSLSRLNVLSRPKQRG